MLWHEFTHCKQFPQRRFLLQCNRKVMTAWQICSRGKKVFRNAELLIRLEASADNYTIFTSFAVFFVLFFFVDNLTNLTVWDQTLWLLYSDLCVRLLSAGSFPYMDERGAVKGEEQVLPLINDDCSFKSPSRHDEELGNTNRCHSICTPEWLSAIPNYTFDVLAFAWGGKSAMKGSYVLVL